MFLRNWARLYSRLTAPEVHAERLICLLGKPYRAQHPFFGERRVVDFALFDDKIIIEVDGPSHDLPVQRRKDLTSTLALEQKGWRTVRFSNAEVLGWRVDWGGEWLWGEICKRLNHRPTPVELTAALQDLDRAFPGLSAKTRKQKRAPGPKKARTRGRSEDSRMKDTTE